MKYHHGQQGFSIVEILMAIGLVGIIFTLASSVSDTSRQSLDEAIGKLERSVRFATNESILRNSIVRINIDLNASPVEYLVEYGPGSDFVLPQAQDTSRLSIREREQEAEKFSKIDNQFMKVEEFSDSNELLPENIRIFGISSTYYPQIMDTGKVYIYFYPTGEKDNSIILFYSDEEIATLELSPFEEKTKIEYIPFSEQELANLEDSLENKTKDIVQKWLKE